MIIGIMLAISLSITLTSFLIVVTSTTGILKENLATGAVIGVSQAASYASIILIIFAIITLFLITIIKKPKH
ncbi:MAG: hypothetical protein V1888_01955 [archaeon]